MLNMKIVAGVSTLVLAVTAAAQVVSSKSAKATKASEITVVSAKNGTGGGVPTLPVSKTVSATGTTAPAPAPTAKPLPPLDLSDMWMWNWWGKWLGSEWDNGNGPIPWRYNHINQPARADTSFTLDANGAPQLQALNGTQGYSRGLWETEVTVPKLRDGVIVAPLWLYDPASRDEVDFEFPGRGGLDVTMHVYVNGVHQQSTTRLFGGQDMSGQRHRFGIKVDETSGYVEMYVDGKMMKRWDRSAMPFFVSQPLKPLIEMWAANPSYDYFVQWAGRWNGFGPNESMTMTVHGYDYTPIS